MGTFANLHLLFARRIQDPVSAATTDGGLVTSSERTDYLNKASREIVAIAMKARRLDTISGLIATDSTSTSGGSKVLPSDFAWKISLTTAGGLIGDYVTPGSDVATTLANPNSPIQWTIKNGSLYIYDGGSAILDAEHVLTYVKDDQQTVTTGDVGIDDHWFEPMVDLAASYFYADSGERQKAVDTLQRAMVQIQSILGAA